MTLRCIYCGCECPDDSIYCSKCGRKVNFKKNNQQEDTPPAINLIEEVSDVDFILEKTENPSNKSVIDEADILQRQETYTFHPTKKYKLLGFVFNFFFIFLIVCSILITATFLVLNKHTNRKVYLEYKNYITNPEQIPELKEPSNMSELVTNLSSVERFMLMYLKFSKDTDEIKGKVFASFLRELDKFPHITNEILISDENDECAQISTNVMAKKCAQKMTNSLSSVGIAAYPLQNTVFLYPDIKYMRDTYAKYLNKEFQQYLNLSARYNKPTAIGLDLYMKPKTLVNKITDYENLYNKVKDENIKEWLESAMYSDFRKLLFTPAIYDTTTQEMTKEFKNAYNYFVYKKRKSAFNPVVVSYLDKERSYNDENFKNDYPYKICDTTFNDTVQNSTFSDVFAQLRQNILTKNEPKSFAYVYNFIDASWQPFVNENILKPNNYVLSDADENTVTVYNNVLSEIQQLNVPSYSRLYLFNNNLLIYSASRLSLSKIIYNGKNFSIQDLSSFEISSIFPGIEVLMIDSYSTNDIALEKDNKRATYMLLSRYVSGFQDYQIMPAANVSTMALPNMFSIDTNNDTIVTFSKPGAEGQESYTLRIHTRGQAVTIPETTSNESDNFVQYDDKTAVEQQSNPDKFEANIKPKIEKTTKPEVDPESIAPPPELSIVPPKDDKE